jgi:hypothetical protein
VPALGRADARTFVPSTAHVVFGVMRGGDVTSSQPLQQLQVTARSRYRAHTVIIPEGSTEEIQFRIVVDGSFVRTYARNLGPGRQNVIILGYFVQQTRVENISSWAPETVSGGPNPKDRTAQPSKRSSMGDSLV